MVERKLTSYPSLFRGRVQSISREKRSELGNAGRKTLVFSELHGEFWYWDMSQGAMILDLKL